MNNPTIRVRAGALLLRDHDVLLIEYDDHRNGMHYAFPGGGVRRRLVGGSQHVSSQPATYGQHSHRRRDPGQARAPAAAR